MEEEDQIVHELSLDDDLQAEAALDVFKVDPEYEESERKFAEIKKEILGESSSDEDSDASDGSSDESDEEEAAAHQIVQQQQIEDQTETNLVNLRRTIYLTIMSSLDFEEAGHKLMKICLQPGQEVEICTMLTECCSRGAHVPEILRLARATVLPSSRTSTRCASTRPLPSSTRQSAGWRRTSCATSRSSSRTCTRRMLPRGRMAYLKSPRRRRRRRHASSSRFSSRSSPSPSVYAS